MLALYKRMLKDPGLKLSGKGMVMSPYSITIALAMARAGAPLTLGLLWTPQVGYRHGIWLLLVLSLAGVAALMLAQRVSLSR